MSYYIDEDLEIRIENNIVIAKYNENILLDFNKMNKFVKKRLEVQNGKEYPVLIYLSLKKVTKEAREYANKEGLEGIKAGAFLVDSFMTKTIFNFFLSVYSPKVPTKLFTSKEEAINWLNEFI